MIIGIHFAKTYIIIFQNRYLHIKYIFTVSIEMKYSIREPDHFEALNTLFPR